MQLEKDFIYHIYNHGNNRRKIFFNLNNYLFFLRKINTYIKPYTDILAWCLMPNHFHLMLFIKNTELPIHDDHNLNKTRTINESIAIMLRSYTRAVNKENKLSGSLFRAHTKAECLNDHNGITPSFINQDSVTIVKTSNMDNQYPQICFNYIHQNPVKAGLVKEATEWEFSSAKDYSGMRSGKLINKNSANKLGLKHSSDDLESSDECWNL